MANLYSKKSEAKRGFKVFSSMSLILNILNLVIGPFYSPAFSMFYMAILYLPGKLFDSLLKSFNMHMSDNVAFFLITISAIIIDGGIGAVISTTIKKAYNPTIYMGIMVTSFLIYWFFVTFAFRISF